MANNENNIYEDITGPQKRANWNLLGALGSDHGLDLTAAVQRLRSRESRPRAPQLHAHCHKLRLPPLLQQLL